jgi:bacteriorhodopsin
MVLSDRVVTTIGMAFYASTRKQPQFDRGDSNSWYFYTASVFAIGIFFSFLALISAKTPEKKALSKVLMSCCMIAMSTYILSAFRLTHALYDLNGYPVDVGRFIEWISTCPVLILLIGEITKSPEIAAATMENDYIMLSLGFLGAITREPYSLFFQMLCFYFFALVIFGLNEMFNNAIEGKTKCTLDKNALLVSKYATLITWNAFAFIWFSVRYNVISFAQGEMLFGLADIGAKVLLTLVLVNATVESAQNEKVEILSGIANDMETELNNSDALLERMMPKEVLEQLKSGIAPGAEEYDCVT